MRFAARCSALLASAAALAATDVPLGVARAQMVEWPAFGGDLASTKFSTLTDIDRGNVARLRRRGSGRRVRRRSPSSRTRPGNFQATPLMIGDTLFLSTSYNRVVALDANSGKEFWEYDPKPYLGRPAVRTGQASCTVASRRGPTASSGGSSSTAAGISSRSTPRRDSRFATFGDTGVVDLTRASRRGTARR